MESVNTNLTCHFCAKNYKRPAAYKKHIIYCELIHKSKSELKNDAEDQESAPSYKDLCDIIKTLICKTNKLEQEITIIKKQLPKSKKSNTNTIIDYLTTTITAPLLFDTWINDLSLDDNHIDIIIHNKSYINSIYEILYDLLKTSKHSILKSFCNSNQIYIFQKGFWNEMNAENWKIIINKIVSESHKQYSKWKSNNINSKISIEEQVIKILGNKASNSLYINVKKKLLEQIQEEIEL